MYYVYCWKLITSTHGCSIFRKYVPNTSESVSSPYVHTARPTNPFPARSPECQGGVLFILYLDKSVQHHGATLVQINLKDNCWNV